ncbi:hypothetical protein QOZ80_7AG0580130 [Eleusine coracana subsp. coracana]|nr:hypothetical protein QOZ80_7AG0580130 [Eleusine coracana subsp. coracana]
MSTEVTTIDSVPDDSLKEIMLRLPTPAALVHAAFVSKSWRRIIATQQFLDEYRKRHSSSPFIGLYIPQEFGGLPSFQMADSIRPDDKGKGGDTYLFRAAERAFSLRGLGRHPEWRILDCHNGRLLLARGDEAVEVYSPFSCKSISVCLPQDDFLPANFSTCLLQGHGDDAASFRVVSVQHRRRPSRMVRAIEYDSRTKEWTEHPWETLKNIEVSSGKGKVMHAGELIFCKCKGSSLLMLDTRSMVFSPLPLPLDNNKKHCVIGEMEDGVCCFASVDAVGLWNNIHFRVWKLEKLEWKLEKDMPMKQLLGDNADNSYYSVRALTNGIALLCSSKRQHFAIDLKTFSVKDKFQFEGSTAYPLGQHFAYPLQMPWPPTFSMPVGSCSRVDAVLLDCSDVNQTLPCGSHDNGLAPAQKEECLDKEKSVLDSYDLENLVPDQDIILSDQNFVLMHLEDGRPRKSSRVKQRSVKIAGPVWQL